MNKWLSGTPLAKIGTAVLLCSLAHSAIFPAEIVDWGNDGVVSQDWAKVDKNNWGQKPSQGPRDPFEYKYELSCLGLDGSLRQLCLNSLGKCNEASSGTHVDWFRRLAGSADINWHRVSQGSCIYSAKPRDVLAEIAAKISHEFQKTPIQAATIGSQPGPHTLRGQDTNFYANAHEQEFNITLLGQKIHITATPASYTWNYGDGTHLGPTISAGAPLPEDRIGEQTKTSHIYTTTGKYTITLTTHFNGSYTVNGGPKLPIPGQGNIQSPPLALTVWRAVTNNYADNCNQNPNGIGC